MTLMRLLRRRKGMSLVDMSRATYYTSTYIGLIETGERRPSSATLETIAKALEWDGDPYALLEEVGTLDAGGRPGNLRTYTIVHHAGFDASGDFDGTEEIVCTVLAPTAERALSTYCHANHVHPETFEGIGNRVWHEWYEAEEVSGDEL